jgi:hypothetical protein
VTDPKIGHPFFSLRIFPPFALNAFEYYNASTNLLENRIK